MNKTINYLILYYDITINTLSKLTEINSVSMYSYAKGKEANRSLELYLRLLTIPSNFYYLYKENKSNLDKTTCKRIEKKLTIILADMKLEELKTFKLN